LNEHDLALNLSNSSSSESTPRNPAPQRATPRKEADPDTDFLLRDDATPRNDVVTDPVAPRYEPASALTIGTSENIGARELGDRGNCLVCVCVLIF